MIHRNPYRAILANVLALLCATAAFAGEEVSPLASLDNKKVKTPAVIVDRSRDPVLTNDYLRMSFLSDPNLVPTTVARPGALRAFFTASRFFEPPIPLANTTSYVGIAVQETQNLAVFRCRPPDPTVAVLATWPNVMNLLQDDLGTRFSCPPSRTSAENQVFCIAAAYFDSPEPSVTRTLENTYIFAGELFDPAFPERANVLMQLYGLFPAFSGLGYAVRGSERGPPFTARDALRNSIVPEYLLPNQTLAAFKCDCIIVPPYAGRSQDPLDPRFVSERGSPECPRVERLLSARGSDVDLATMSGELIKLQQEQSVRLRMQAQ